VDRCAAFDSLGLDALFGPETGVDRVWPARCADELRRAVRVVSWFGSRDADFVRRLTSLIPCVVVAPSVGADRPVWEHLLETVAPGDKDASRWREPIAVSASVVDAGRRELKGAGWDGRTPVLVVHPGAGGRTKQWPAQGFASVLGSLEAVGRPMVVIHRGPADADAVEALRPRIARGVALLEEPPLAILAGVLSHACAYLGNDSGISHLAAVLGVRSTVLFTADHVAWRPWLRHVEPLIVSTQAVEPADVDRVRRALAAAIE
jgi:ADP-heptose:LPS heptosyltransferase